MSTTARVLLMADTHIGPTRPSRRLPDAVYDLLVDGVDAIEHAGDVTDAELLRELSGFAPVHAVLGNNDSLELPERIEVDIAVSGSPPSTTAVLLRVARPGSTDGSRPRRLWSSATRTCRGTSPPPTASGT